MAVPKKKNIKTKAKLLQSFYKKEKNKAYLNCILCYPDLMTMIFAISYTKTSEFEQKLKLETDPEKKKIIEQE